MKTLLATLAFASTLCLPLTASVCAMMVLPTDLPTLVTDADRIFAGTVVAVEERQDEHGILCTYITVRIFHLLKGQLPTVFTFKQLGTWTRQGQGTPLRIPGMPVYHKGEEVVLLLRPTSTAGFTSPVGMEQGKFRVVRDGTKAQVINALGNANVLGLFAGGDNQQALTAPGQGALHDPALDLDSFLSVIEELASKP